MPRSRAPRRVPPILLLATLVAAGVVRLAAGAAGAGCTCDRDGCGVGLGSSCPIARAAGGHCPSARAAAGLPGTPGERMSARCGCRHDAPAFALGAGEPLRLAPEPPSLGDPLVAPLDSPLVAAAPRPLAAPPEPPPPRPLDRTA